MQVIEKGMTFVMSHEPYVVGVVQSAKDKAAQRYLLKLTDGSEVIWNNRLKTYNVKRILLPLSEDTKLPSLKEKAQLITEASRSNFELSDGDMYHSKDGYQYLMISLSNKVKIFEESYDFIGVCRDVSAPIAYFKKNGKCSSPVIELDEDSIVSEIDLSDLEF